MMQFYGKVALLTLVMGILATHVWGQNEPGGLYLSGKITTEQGSVNGTIIRMTRNAQPMNDYQVLPDGKFNLRFEFNNDYVLIFSRAENFPQKIAISTAVPTDVLRRDRKFPPFPVDINLFTEIQGIDRTFSENAIMKIFYSADVDNFISEVYYNNPQIKKLIDQAVWQAQNVSRESDLLKRLSAAELAELKKDYNELLKKAGSEFDKAEYIAALGDYKSASRIFPSEQFPRDRIAEINDLIAVLGLQADLEKQMTLKYNEFIRQADLQFSTKNYSGAKDNYDRALTVRPDDTYASGRITEIDNIVAGLERMKKYTDLIALADNSFNEKLLEQAKSRYQEAAKVRPEDPYPAAQIAKIDQQLNNLSLEAKKQSDYEAAVLNGDASYQKQFYSKAQAFYETALALKPGDQAVIAKIERIKNEQKQIADKLFYDESIASADKAFKQKEYAQAKELYNAALAARPDQSYPSRQIEAIDKIMERFNEYDRLIASGDNFMGQQKWAEAREDFRVALNIKPGENYPAQKVKEIDAMLATEAKADQQYRQLIAGADKFFTDSKLAQARSEYQKAATIRPADGYPPEMIAKIDALEAEQKRLAAEKEAEEKRLIADREAEQQRLLAQQAEEKRLKEEEQRRILAEREAEEKARMLAEMEVKDRTYKTLIDEADQLAANQALAEAVGKFRAALEVKPQESYPIQRIEEIRGIIARQTETKKNFDKAISQGDNAFRQQQYTGAKDAYRQAQQLIATETYPTEMLAKIDSIETEIARIAQEKAATEEAARLARIAEEERIAAEKKAIEERVAAEKEAARLAKLAEDERIAAEKEAARLAKAAEDERIAQEKAAAEEAARLARVAEQERVAAEKRAVEERVAAEKEAARLAKLAEEERIAAEKETARLAKAAEDERIAQEKAATEEAARLARVAEQERIAAEKEAARLAKAAEDERIAQQKAAAEEAARLAVERTFKEKTDAGDQALAARNPDEAEKAYKDAQRIKPGDSYPAQQLKRVDELRADILEERFTGRLTAGDQALAAEQFDDAEKAYREAGMLIPNDKRVTEKLAETARQRQSRQLALQEAEKKNRDYARFITQGDNAFQMKNFVMAASNYRNASDLKPDENWPKQRIAQIDSIKEAITRDDQFRTIILAADAAYRTSNWEVAKDNYKKALEVKPGESYPEKQIAAIDATLQRLAEQKAQPPVAEKTTTPAEPAPSQPVVQETASGDDAMRNDLYASLIATADQTFDGKEYNVSRAWYYKALEIRSNETYPRSRIDEINKILGSMQLSARDREFQQYIDQGDEAFRGGQLAIARSWYNRSLNIRPNDKYPISQIAEIQYQISEQLQGSAEKVAADYVAQGDKALGLKQYNVARIWYQRALQLKPRDPGIMAKLEELRKAQTGQ